MVDDNGGIGTVDGSSTTTQPPQKDAVTDGARPSSRRVAVVVSAALVVALAASTAVLGWSWWQQDRLDTLRAEAIDVTRDYAQTIATFDYQNLDAGREKVAGMSTPEFAGKYNEMVDALSRIVTDGQGQATGSVTNVGIESLDGSDATVLVFVDQEAKNVIAPEGKSQKYRMVVTLDRDGDRWVVDNVETR